jgi:hypothetical protein
MTRRWREPEPPAQIRYTTAYTRRCPHCDVTIRQGRTVVRLGTTGTVVCTRCARRDPDVMGAYLKAGRTIDPATGEWR